MGRGMEVKESEAGGGVLRKRFGREKEGWITKRQRAWGL